MMKRGSFLVAVFLMTSATQSAAQDWQNVKTRDAFVSAVQGKTLSSGGGRAMINADGSTHGTLANGSEYSGNWIWDGGRYCRNLVVDGQETGTLCARIDIAGNKVRFSNLGGNESVSVWTAR